MKAVSIKKFAHGNHTPSSTAQGKKTHKTFDYLVLPPHTVTSRNPDDKGLKPVSSKKSVSGSKNGVSEYYYKTFTEEGKQQ